MHFPWKWEFGLTLSKLQNFGTPLQKSITPIEENNRGTTKAQSE
jgi:hypothetical protein